MRHSVGVSEQGYTKACVKVAVQRDEAEGRGSIQMHGNARIDREGQRRGVYEYSQGLNLRKNTESNFPAHSDGDDDRRRERMKKRAMQNVVLCLAERFVPCSRAPASSQRETHQQALPQCLPSALSTNLALFANPSPLRLGEAFDRDIIQCLVLNSKLAARCPKVLAVPDDAQVERVRCFGSACKTVRSFPLREAIKPEEIHEEPTPASTTHPTPMMMMRMRERSPWLAGSVIVRSRVSVLMAHLAHHRRTAAAAHEPIPTEIADFQSGHLAGDLPELGGEKDDGPGELEGGPEGNGDEEGVVGGDGTEGFG